MHDREPWTGSVLVHSELWTDVDLFLHLRHVNGNSEC